GRGGPLEVLRVVVAPADNDESLEPARDVQLALVQEADVSGSEDCLPVAARKGCRADFRGFRLPVPVTLADGRAGGPALAQIACLHRLTPRRIDDGDLHARQGRPVG